MKVPTETVLGLAITNSVLRPWIKSSTAFALADAFGCYDADLKANVDPTVAQVLALTDKQIIDAPKLDAAAVRQVHALREAING